MAAKHGPPYACISMVSVYECRANACRLLEAAVWASSRWADTYLFAEESVASNLQTAFGHGGRGDAVLTGLAEVAGMLLGSPVWDGEVDLHRAVACHLLPVLVRRRPVAAALVKKDAWLRLAGALFSL